MRKPGFIRDQVILITGASSGIGRAAAILFAALGAKVVLASRNNAKLASVAKDIISSGGNALSLVTDVSSTEETKKMAAGAIANYGKIDVLIACAGKYVQDETAEIDIGKYQDSFSVNFYGTINAVKSVLPEMKRQKKGHIVIINSLDSKKGIIGDGPYVAAKSALDGFADVLRQEMKPFNINVISVYPGRVDTPMIENIRVPGISKKITPEKVARSILKAIKRNKARIVVPSSLFMIAILNYLMPRFSDWAYHVFKIEGQKIS